MLQVGHIGSKEKVMRVVVRAWPLRLHVTEVTATLAFVLYVEVLQVDKEKGIFNQKKTMCKARYVRLLVFNLKRGIYGATETFNSVAFKTI